MRAFETGRFRNTAEKHWKEFYDAPVSPPDWGQHGPFISELTGIIRSASHRGDDHNNVNDIEDASGIDKSE